MVAAVTWLAELFEDKTQREWVIGWTLATASLGGLFVTEVYNHIVGSMRRPPPTAVPGATCRQRRLALHASDRPDSRGR